MNKINVLQVNKLYFPTTGGVERVVQQIAEGLLERTNMQVLVCKEKGKGSKDIVNGVTVHRAGSLGVLFSLPISFSFFSKLRTLSKNQDVIHFHMPFPLGDLACLLSGYKGKVVVWWHSDIVRQKKLMKIYKPLMTWFLNRADVIIVATQGHIDGSSYLKPYEHKCRIVPFGVDKKMLAEANAYIAQKQVGEEETKQIDKKVRFLFVGRLVEYKGCKVLLKAFANIRGAELVIVGSGSLGTELELLAQEQGAEDRVHFLGNISDEALKEEFKKCDVFVLPSISKNEAFGLVQFEAMVYAKPVINTNLPSGVPYVSLHKITGLTVEPSDIDGLKDAMQWMVEHKAERKEMGKKARERALKNFDMDHMLDEVMNIYEELV